MKKTIMYSAPLVITLAGSACGLYGGSVLMMALNEGVTVRIRRSENLYIPEGCEIILKTIELLVFKKTSIPTYSCEIQHTYSMTSRSVQAGFIVAATAALLELRDGQPAPREMVQKIAYQVEKKIFKLYSFAQTVAATSGGIVFYRKEFSFFKTVVKLPMKLPHGFLTQCVLQSGNDPETKKVGSDRVVRQLVFAIQTESLERWHAAFLKTRHISFQDLTLDYSSDAQTFSEDFDGYQRK